MDEYVESIQTCFEEDDREIPNEGFCKDLIECIRAVDEWASYSTPSARDFESSEISELKRKIEKLEAEKQEGWDAFRNNVANRHNCHGSRIELSADGGAHIRP